MNQSSLPKKRFQCSSCGQIIEVSQRVPKPPRCPACGASAFVIHRLDPGPPGGRRDLRGGRQTKSTASLPMISPNLEYQFQL